jgi:threonyl-tRNA synthetase
MAPVQAAVLPINDDLEAYAAGVNQELITAGLRTQVDSRTESLNKKIREAQLANIPLILTIGKKEQAAKTLSVRTLNGHVKMGVTHEEFLNVTLAHIKRKALDLPIF